MKSEGKKSVVKDNITSSFGIKISQLYQDNSEDLQKKKTEHKTDSPQNDLCCFKEIRSI